MSQAVLIAGMHRSGTSLAASLIQRGGLFIGNELAAPGADNPHGYFEDVEFLHFHEHALRARKLSIFVPEDFRFVPTDAELATARAIVQARANQPMWGWKDPRSTLFLDFWHEQIPGLAVVAVYRHPLDVLLSLVRRADQFTVGLIEALDAWATYNARILEYRERRPERCLVLSTYRLLEQLPRARALLSERIGLTLDLSPEAIAEIYRAEELRRTPLDREVLEILEALHPESARVYAALEAKADLPAQQEVVPGDGDERVHHLKQAVLAAPEVCARPMSRALLLRLCAILAPKQTERLYVQHLAQLAEFEVFRDWSESERSWWKKEAEAAKARAEQALATVGGLERTRRLQDERIAELEVALQRATAETANLASARAHDAAELERTRLQLNAQEQRLAIWDERIRRLRHLIPDWALDRLRSGGSSRTE